jgi:hypothetical protein
MRKISLYVIATFLVLTGVGGWIASTTQARVEAPVLAETINPSQIGMNARDLPNAQFTDYTFVFN